MWIGVLNVLVACNPLLLKAYHWIVVVQLTTNDTPLHVSGEPIPTKTIPQNISLRECSAIMEDLEGP